MVDACSGIICCLLKNPSQSLVLQSPHYRIKLGNEPVLECSFGSTCLGDLYERKLF